MTEVKGVSAEFSLSLGWTLVSRHPITAAAGTVGGFSMGTADRTGKDSGFHFPELGFFNNGASDVSPSGIAAVGRAFIGEEHTGLVLDGLAIRALDDD